MDDNAIYTKLPDEYDSDPSIKYHAYLPNVTVYGEKPYRESANKPMEGLPFLNAATLGLANNLSMSHNIGVLKDIVNPNKSWMDVTNSQINGNNGVVSDKYAEEHPIKSNLINLGLDILSPGIVKMGINGGVQSKQILENIKHRNLIAFNTIFPFGYDNAYGRGKKYLKALLTTKELPEFNKLEGKMPEWYEPSSYNEMENRAGAWRKYLQIPDEQYNDVDIYDINPDGKTWHYNKKALEAAGNDKAYINKAVLRAKDGKMVTKDFITGNGGNVQVDLSTIKDDAGNPLYRKGIMTDIFDLQPFQNGYTAKPFENLIRGAAEKANTNYYSGNIENNGLLNTLILKRLKNLKREKLNAWAEEPPKVIKFLDNIVYPKMRDFEIGKLVNGKPFTLEHPFYYTQDESGNLITKNVFYNEKPFPYDVGNPY